MLNLCGFPASFALPEAGGAQVGDSFDFGSLLQKKWEARYQQTTGFRFSARPWAEKRKPVLSLVYDFPVKTTVPAHATPSFFFSFGSRE